MKVINIEDRLEQRRNETWWWKISNVVRVLELLSTESKRIIDMVNAHGDKDKLEDRCVYPGIHEYFCEEPALVEAEPNNLKSEVKDIAPGRYVLILDVMEDLEGDGFKYGRLTYMKKIVGEPL